MDFSDLLRLVWQRRWLILALTAILGLGSVLSSRLRPPAYETAAKVLIRNGVGFLPFGTTVPVARGGDYVEIARSRVVLNSAATALAGAGGNEDEVQAIHAQLRTGLSVKQMTNANVLLIVFRAAEQKQSLVYLRQLLESMREYSVEIQQQSYTALERAIRAELTRASSTSNGEAQVQLRNRETDLRLAQASCQSEVEIIEGPTPLGEANRVRVFFNLCVALFWGLVLGGGLAILLDGKRGRAGGGC